MSQPAQRPLTPVLIVLVSLAGIFVAPYYVPVSGPNGSMSWEFGFSNGAAQGFIALMLLALFFWRLFAGAGAEGLARVLRSGGESQSSRSLWWTMAVVQLVMTAVIVAWYRFLPYSHYGEITYFIQRIEAMILGRQPYRDFTFDYGPAMLAIPVFVYRLFHGDLSVEAAYTIVLVLHCLAGFALLAYLVSRLSVTRHRALIFALIAVPFISLTMGLNYTPLRFTVALAAIFAVRQLYLLPPSPLRWLLLILAALLFPVLNFAISPEMGLALTFGLLTYFGWFLFGSERRFALLALPVAAGVAMAVHIFPSAYFSSMASFGKGGASFPILPTIQILIFLAAAIWVLPRLGVIAIRERSGLAPFAAGIAILCGLFILPATGRCDAGHVYINSLGLFLLALAATTHAAPKWRYSILGLYFVVFLLIGQVTFWNNYDDPIEGAIHIHQQLSNYPYQPDNYANLPPGAPRPVIHYSKLLPARNWLDELPDAKIGLPLGADEGLERFLILTGRAAPEYHMAPFSDIFEPSQLARKFADLRTMDYVFVSDYYLRYLELDHDPHIRVRDTIDCKSMPTLLEFPLEDPRAKAPLFLSAGDGLDRYLTLSQTAESSLDNLFEPAQLQQNFAHLLAIDQVFVSQYYLDFHQPDPFAQMEAQGVSDCRAMSSLLLFPISLPAIHPLFQADFAVMRRIAQDYVLARQCPTGLLLKRKDLP